MPVVEMVSASNRLPQATGGEAAMSLFKNTQVLGSNFETTGRYTDMVPIGTGISGLVCSATDLIIRQTVVVKKLSEPFQTAHIARYAFREIRLLRHLRHENVINFMDTFISPSEDIYFVTEYMKTDLHALLQNSPLDEKFAQFFLYQIMRALKYIHSAGVIHRDLKPSNILINENCDLKVCDFGLARVQEHQMTGYVSTRYYRAPEIMLWWQRYTEKVDIWSSGCIFAEMLLGRPLFPGKDHIHQFSLITQLLGKPPSEMIDQISNTATREYIYKLEDQEAKPLSSVFSGVNWHVIDLLSKMLVFDPDKRISAVEAMESPYLETYHDPSDEPLAQAPLDWTFLKAELPVEKWKLRIYQEVLGFHAHFEPSESAERWAQFDVDGISVDEAGDAQVGSF